MFTNCSMRYTFFRNCNMIDAMFTENDMTGAVLDGSDVKDATFLRCNVTNLSLINTNVDGTKFIDCNENGNPITIDWLRSCGAINADNAIIVNSLDENQSASKIKLKPINWHTANFMDYRCSTTFMPYRQQIMQRILEVSYLPTARWISCDNLNRLRRYIQLPLNNTTFPELDIEDPDTMIALRDTHTKIVIEAIDNYLFRMDYFNSSHCRLFNEIIFNSKVDPIPYTNIVMQKIFENCDKHRTTCSVLPDFLRLDSSRKKHAFYNTIIESEEIYRDNHPEMANETNTFSNNPNNVTL